MTRIMSVWVVGIVFLIGIAAADEVSELRKQMEQQYEQMQQMQNKLNELEAAQKQQSMTVAKLEETGGTSLPETLKWLEKIKLYGDFRYRYEMVDEDGSDNRNRNRIRARLGLTAKINDEIDTGFRLATSELWGDDEDSGDPVSTNQTLDDAFSKKSIWLDLAYFNWHPAGIQGFNVIGGKMENPFYRVGGNQLIFDSDLTPEGIAFQYTHGWTEQTSWFVNGGGFYVDEVKSGADTSLWGVQGGIKHTFQDKSYLVGGGSLYCFGNIQGHGAFVTVNGSDKFFGNSKSGGLYINDYDLTELFGEYGFKLADTPTAVFANYVKNTVAAGSENAGWLIGTKYGKCKDPGSWELSYDYRDLKADAVVGAFSDSDFIGGGTDGKGHRFSAVYQLAKNTQAGLTYFLNEKGHDDHDYNRLQLDLMFKF
ncbi:MAG TPA: putative porin [Anaerohalosphaeraceae bacterium]|nr:putative porin [Anaerohalosphaeraceae bacterium]